MRLNVRVLEGKLRGIETDRTGIWQDYFHFVIFFKSLDEENDEKDISVMLGLKCDFSLRLDETAMYLN